MLWASRVLSEVNKEVKEGKEGPAPRDIKNSYFTEMCSGSEAGSYLRLMDFVSLNSRLESSKEEEKIHHLRRATSRGQSKEFLTAE